jgi:hypothetical protein
VDDNGIAGVWALHGIRLRTADLDLRVMTEADLPVLARVMPADLELNPHATRYAGLDEPANRRALVDRDLWPELDHHPAAAHIKPRGRRACGSLLGARLRRIDVGCAPPVKRVDRALVFDADADRAERVAIKARGKRRSEPGAVAHARVERRRVGPGQQQFEPMVAGVDQPIQTNDAPRIERVPAADARHKQIADRQVRQSRRRLGWHAGGLRILDDRRKRSVDVKQKRRGAGL